MSKIYKLFFLKGVIFLFLAFPLIGFGTEEEEDSTFHCNPDLFEENKGQFPAQSSFKVKISPILHLYLENGGFSYVFRDEGDVNNLFSHHDHDEVAKTKNGIVNCHLVKANFINSNKRGSWTKIEPSPGVYNYFIGNDPKKWAVGVKKYGAVSYNNLYNGINLNMYCKGGSLKYDIVVKAGADPSQIKYDYNGATSLNLVNGGLKIETSEGDLFEILPKVYQNINGKEVLVKCEYNLEGTTVNYIFSSGFDKNYDLIIDPQLIAATYSGAESDNWGVSATYDREKNIYLGGTIGGGLMGAGYPVTPGAFQQNYGGMNPIPGAKAQGDAVISKFNQDGTELIYATYLGGSGIERPQSMVVNEDLELYVFGATNSNDFPMATGNVFDRDHNGGFDIYIVKLSADGTQLLSSTFLGGSDDDGINENPGLNPEILNSLHYNYGDNARGEITLGSDNSVYIASSTKSDNFPIFGGFSGTISGGQDGCVVKLNADLSGIGWSSYLGGSEDDVAFSMVLDKQGNAFVTGGTKSSDFPTTQGVINPNFSGVVDGFVTGINADGSAISASTFIGTEAFDQTYFIQLDKYDEVYVFGLTKGNYPVQAAAPTIYEDPGSPQFVHKMSKTLDETHFSTVFGNGDEIPNISPTAFLVDTCEVLFFSGYGRAANIPDRHIDPGNTNGMTITNDAFKTTTDGRDFYFLILQRDAEDIFYGTYFGEDGITDHVDGGTARFDKNGTVYQSICACGRPNGLPTLPGAKYPRKGTNGGCNSYILKFYLDRALLSADADISAGDGCAPLEVTFTNGSLGAVDYIWDFGDGTPRSTEFEPTHVFTEVGTYKVMLIAIDSSKCIVSDTAYVDVVVGELRLEVTGGSICLGDSFQVSVDSDGDVFQWTPDDGSLSDVNIKNPIAKPTVTTTYTVTGKSDFCESTKEITIEVLDELILEIDGDSICEGDSTQLYVKTDADSYTWIPPVGLSNPSIRDPKASPAVTTTYTVEGVLDGCKGAGEVTVVVVPKPKADFMAVPWETFMDDPNFVFKDLSENGVVGRWDFGDNQTGVYVPKTDVPHTYNIADIKTFPITYLVKLYIENELGCPDSITHEVKITGDWTIYVPNVFSPNGDGINDKFFAFGSGIQEFKMLVYNRWGEVVFRSDDLHKGWDGTVKNKEGGELTKQDVYVWKIVLVNIFGKKHRYIGHVTLTK